MRFFLGNFLSINLIFGSLGFIVVLANSYNCKYWACISQQSSHPFLFSLKRTYSPSLHKSQSFSVVSYFNRTSVRIVKVQIAWQCGIFSHSVRIYEVFFLGNFLSINLIFGSLGFIVILTTKKSFI